MLQESLYVYFTKKINCKSKIAIVVVMIYEINTTIYIYDIAMKVTAHMLGIFDLHLFSNIHFY